MHSKFSHTCILTWLILIIPLIPAHSKSPDRQKELDSLYSVWQNIDQPDSLRIEAYHKYIWEGYMFSEPEVALKMTKELTEFSKAHQIKWAISLCHNLMGAYYYSQSDYDNALEEFKIKLEIDREGNNPVAIARSLGNIGLVLQMKGDYPGALRHFLSSYELKEQNGDRQGVAISATNIGVVYLDKGMYQKALEYLEISRAIEEELNDKQGLAGTYINIGNIYSNLQNDQKAEEYYKKGIALCDETGQMTFKANALGNLAGIYRDRKNYEESLRYYWESYEIRKEMGDQNAVATSLNNIGNIYQSMGNYDEALKHLEQSLAISTERRNSVTILKAKQSIGNLKRHTGDYSQSVKYCTEALEIAMEIESFKYQSSSCSCLYKTYKLMGNPTMALKYHELKLVNDDSLRNDEIAQQLQRIEFEKLILADSIKVAEEKRLIQEEYEMDLLKESRTRNIALASGFLFLLLAGGFYSRWRYVRKSKAIIEKERDRSENLLLNILPEEIAEELKEKGRADARDFDMVSILFTDFVEFTRTSQKLTATELVHEINQCFEAFDHIIEKFRIEKIKTIGDAYMAAGGLPVPTEVSVKNTVLAALEMQKFIVKRETENRILGKPAFDMRVGIHTGPVVAGIVGVKKFQYDVWGDTVNTASRMESHGEPGKVNISQTTNELLLNDPQFIFEERGKIPVKGKGEIEMFFVSFRNE